MNRALTIPTALALALAVALPLGACREDAGPPNAALLEGWENPPELSPEPLEGPDPWVTGESRFNLGLFYEGGSSDFAPIDSVTSNYFIFEAFAGGPLTYTQLDDPRRRVEGLVSARIVHGGLTFWGGGVFWSAPRDVSRWAVMHVSLMSSDPAFAEIDLGVQSGGADFTVAATDYGYVNDGEWHHLEIPLADFVDDGADLTALTSPFFFGGGAGASGAFCNIDALYWTAP